MRTLSFAAQGTFTGIFQIIVKAEIWFDVWSTNWNGATLTLTCDERSNGTYHTLYPATDSGDVLTGAALTISSNLTTPMKLGPGVYGVTIAAATPTDPIKLHVSHRYLREGENAESYYLT